MNGRSLTRAAWYTGLALVMVLGAGPARAGEPLSEVAEVLHGRTYHYQQNLSKLALFGQPPAAQLRAALAKTGLVLRETTSIRGVTVISVETSRGRAPTRGDLEVAARRVSRLAGVSGTGHVHFAGEGLVVPTGRVWVYLPRGTGAAAARARLRPLGLILEEYLDAAHGVAIARPSGGYQIDTLVATLRARGHEVAPERMRRYRRHLIPTDPYFADQWYLRNTGANVKSAYLGVTIEAQALADARVTDAWDTTTGAATTLVGVIDSGTDCTHPELSGKCEQPYNAVTNEPTSAPPDPALDASGGHGTAVAGIVSAPINDVGMVGVCPSCRVVPVRLIERATFLTDQMMLRAFTHAVDAGAAVINNSWGPAAVGEYVIPVGQGELEGIQYAGLGRGGLGVLVVYAAGNEESDTQYLGHLTTGEANVMAVAASNHHDRRSVYSNFGTALHVSAPTNDMFITPSYISLEIVGAGDYHNDYTFTFGGTSAAAPVVSGVAALILSVAPSKTAAEVRNLLVTTADKIDPDGGFYSAGGHSPLYGFGRVNAYRAVLAAQGTPDPACASPAASDSCATHLDEDCDYYVDESCSQDTAVGDLCSSATECGLEGYWECPPTGKVRGACTWSCSDIPCPAGTGCLQGLCAPYCNTEHPCPNPSEVVCTDDVLGFCLLKCQTNDDCPVGEKCDPAKAYCVLDTDGLIGSACTFDECLGPGAMCLSPGMGFPDGYCTHTCVDDADCDDGLCIQVQYGGFCYRNCTFDGDCRPGYICEQAGPRAGTCYKTCDKDSQCTGSEPGWETVICELSTGRCIDTQEDGGVQDDAGTVDGGGLPDGGLPSSDGGPDAPATNGGGGDGCSCRVGSGASRASPWWLLLALAALLPRHRRRH